MRAQIQLLDARGLKRIVAQLEKKVRGARARAHMWPWPLPPGAPACVGLQGMVLRPGPVADGEQGAPGGEGTLWGSRRALGSVAVVCQAKGSGMSFAGACAQRCDAGCTLAHHARLMHVPMRVRVSVAAVQGEP